LKYTKEVNMPDEDLLEAISAEVDEMSEEDLEAEAKKILAQQEKRKEYTKNRVASPEAKARQKNYRQKVYQKNQAILAKYKELHPEEFETAEVAEEPE
jgi:F420-0:gamma-glutamyl ligase